MFSSQYNMLPPLPINFAQWVADNEHLLKPPVNSFCLYQGTDFIVMCIGGPNNRNDYHINETEEWFYQVKGDMSLHLVVQNQEHGDNDFVQVNLKQGDMYLLPPNTPHNPVRFKDTIGLVIERVRTKEHVDRLRWYCKRCKLIVYENQFQCTDLATQLKVVIDTYNADSSLHTCASCGYVNLTSTTSC